MGWSSLGEAFNEWCVRGPASSLHPRGARRRWPGAADANVLDVGSGTGFYLDVWQRLGVSHITGSDLTEVAVQHLAQRFPAAAHQGIDIGAAAVPLPERAYDAISIVDVLFHIVDDERYAQALVEPEWVAEARRDANPE